METTWDGLPVAAEPPFAACVVVWREVAGGREFLVLHRLAPGGADYEGEWAWTPPSGARLPGEEPDEAARRELYEETGLALELVPAPADRATEDVALYVAQAAPGDEIRLDAEHDPSNGSRSRTRWIAASRRSWRTGSRTRPRGSTARRSRRRPCYEIGTKPAHTRAKILASVRSGGRAPPWGRACAAARGARRRAPARRDAAR